MLTLVEYDGEEFDEEERLASMSRHPSTGERQ